MKPYVLVFLLILMTLCLLVSLIAMGDKAWMESTCFGVWALILERAMTIVNKDMQ